MKRPSIVIIIFLAVLGGVASSVLGAFQNTDQVSRRENRTLSEAPELTSHTWLSGDFAREAEAFLADHACGRDRLLDYAVDFQEMLKKEMDVRIVTQNADMGERRPGAVQASGAGEDIRREEDQGEETEERILLKDRVLVAYASDERARNGYAEAASAFFDLFPDTVTKGILIVPTRIAFEPDYQDYAGGQRADIREAYEKLDAFAYKVDVWEELAAEDVNEIYFRTDHHWTMDGSYIGARAYLNAVGRSCLPKEEYQRLEGEPFLGYLYAQTGQQSLEEHRDKLVYYVHPDGISKARIYRYGQGDEPEPAAREEAVLDPDRQGYYTFIGKSFIYAVIEGKAGDGSCLLLVGDSYCNALAPWLADHFGKVVVIDPRNWTRGKNGLTELAEKEGVTDVLMADYASVLTNRWFTEQIENMTE